MELTQLYYFRATAELQHFTRAAESLHIAQPTLSKAIANLENELGVRLFERKGKHVRLNAFGEAYLERVTQILTELEDAGLMLRDMREGTQGRVRVGASFPITSPSPVYAFQRAFFRNNPGIALFLHVYAADAVERLLLQRELDLGLTTSPASADGLESVPLYTDRLGVIVGKGHRLSRMEEVPLRELKGEKFLCNSAAPDPNNTTPHLCALAGFRPEILYEGESAELIGETVARGGGVSFVSEARFLSYREQKDAPDWQNRLCFVRLSDAFCTRTVYLLRTTMGYRTAAAERFCSALIESCRE